MLQWAHGNMASYGALGDGARMGEDGTAQRRPGRSRRLNDTAAVIGDAHSQRARVCLQPDQKGSRG